MNRKIAFIPDNYYHIYNRGVEKRKIFLEEKDYRRFLILLSICNGFDAVNIRDNPPEDQIPRKRKETLVDIGAYCLMPNHFHLLIREKSESGITNFMRKLGTAYAMYFNKKNKRNGGLFQGKFGAQLLNNDNYLKYIFAYVHLNPIKLIEPEWKEKGVANINKAKDFLDNYIWSSYSAYMRKKQNDPILNKKAFPEYFENAKEFKDFIDDWLQYKEDVR